MVTYLTEATLGRVSLASGFQGYSPAQGEWHVCEGVSTGIQGRWSHGVHGQEAEGERDMTVNARAGFFFLLFVQFSLPPMAWCQLHLEWVFFLNVI